MVTSARRWPANDRVASDSLVREAQRCQLDTSLLHLLPISIAGVLHSIIITGTRIPH